MGEVGVGATAHARVGDKLNSHDPGLLLGHRLADWCGGCFDSIFEVLLNWGELFTDFRCHDLGEDIGKDLVEGLRELLREGVGDCLFKHGLEIGGPHDVPNFLLRQTRVLCEILV